MRKQLEVDIKGCMNQDLASVMKDLMEKHNALVADFNSLLAKMDADFADVTNASVDYVSSETSLNTISID